jgi:hypothetical protein
MNEVARGTSLYEASDGMSVELKCVCVSLQRQAKEKEKKLPRLFMESPESNEVRPALNISTMTLGAGVRRAHPCLSLPALILA